MTSLGRTCELSVNGLGMSGEGGITARRSNGRRDFSEHPSRGKPAAAVRLPFAAVTFSCGRERCGLPEEVLQTASSGAPHHFHELLGLTELFQQAVHFLDTRA